MLPDLDMPDTLPVGITRVTHLLSKTSRRNRLVALLAACALVVCGAVYAAHGLSDRGHEHEHCDLCVHFSGSAGSPAQAKVAGKPVLVVRAILARPQLLIPLRSPSRAHLPRGPPP
jgi:hypothetical protein